MALHLTPHSSKVEERERDFTFKSQSAYLCLMVSLSALSILSDKLLISRRENNTLNTKQFEEGGEEKERVEVAAAAAFLSF